MWEMSITQLDFEQRAPAGCLQYMKSTNGTIRSLNYLPKSGRYLANYDYLICIRQEWGMCSIAYTPCGPNTFSIGGPNARKPLAFNETVRPQDDNAEEGSGSGGIPVVTMKGQTRARCKDRVLIPCDFEEFITVREIYSFFGLSCVFHK
ncbi:hypothetical protein QAD02_023160 [Eretmocerus hayati]|uniref:Uncharacterized protein n=1 Tax=Eretmocerus hayati TaxID=131215 RepID=A0ACC2PV15_9HYME|nr:hypothetical protein QAD02_023160 [Eretmocerus hayati]